MTSKPSAAKFEDEARAEPAPESGSVGDPFEIIERAVAETTEDAPAALAALRDRVAWLTDERDGLLELNAALERENDELNVALLKLAIEKQPDWEAAPARPEPAQAAAVEPEPEQPVVENEPEPAEIEPAFSFAKNGDTDVFDWPLGDGTARLAFTPPGEGRLADIRLELPAGAIDPAAGFDGPAVIGLDRNADRHDDQDADVAWSSGLRSEVSEALGSCAAAIENALATGVLESSQDISVWTAASAYSAAIGRRARSPSLGGELVGPLCLDGFGASEATDAPERGSTAMRWIVAETGRLLVFLTRKGRLRLSIAARNIARDQSLTIRIDGDTMFDADLEEAGPDGPQHVVVDADLEWGPHEIEIVVPSFEREQGGDFRRLHLLIERCDLSWQEYDERYESEEELFGWAPPLWRAAAVAPLEPGQDEPDQD